VRVHSGGIQGTRKKNHNKEPTTVSYSKATCRSITQRLEMVYTHCIARCRSKYSSSTCICSTNLVFDTIFQRLLFISWFPGYRVAANKEITAPRVSGGHVLSFFVWLLIVLSVFRFMIYDYPFGIFKLFLVVIVTDCIAWCKSKVRYGC
jgi:hypothetical protein